MPDFLPKTRGLTIAEIVALTRAEPAPGVPLDVGISDIAPLNSARASDISFLDNPKYLGALGTTRAGACLVTPRFAKAAPARLAVLVTGEPYRAFVIVARALFPDVLRPLSLFGTAGRASEAHVHPTARLEAGVTIDPLAVIGPIPKSVRERSSRPVPPSASPLRSAAIASSAPAQRSRTR